ncbi:MAG: ABC transporter permease [Thermoanaerobaculia bacterium]
MKRRLFLLSELVRRDLAVRYAGSFGGAAWAILNPLILCGLYTLVFAVIVRISPPADFRGTYAEFLLAGLLPWLGFQDGLVRGASAIVDQAHLVKKMSFPVALLVVASLASAMVLQTAGLVVFASLSGGFGSGHVRPLAVAAGFALEILLLVGPTFAFAAASVLFRDLAQLLPPLLTVVFYLTPVLYPESLVPRSLAGILDLNPFRDVVALFRAGLIGTASPPAARVALWMAVSCVLAFLGHRFFERSRKVFADVL